MLTRVFRPTNRRLRIVVGLFLAGLFCIQCSRTEAFRQSDFAVAIDGNTVGKTAPDVVKHLEKLARTDHIALMRFCLEHYEGRYRDYTCTLIKQERIRGKVGKEQWISVKFLDKPFSVAMAWTKNAPIGDRILYVEGKYGGNMLVRPKNSLARRLLGTVKRSPTGKEARKNSLRTVDRFGFQRSLRNLLAVYVEAKKAGDLKESFGGYAKVLDRNTIVAERHLTDSPKYPSCKTRVFIDVEHLMPICVEGYDSDNNLICRYVYKDVKFNVGLKADDFLPKANGMDPPKK